MTKANSPLHSPLVGNPAVIQGLDLDTSRPKIDETTLDRYHTFSNQREPSKGAIIQDLRKSSEELNVKVKHSKPSLAQLSSAAPSQQPQPSPKAASGSSSLSVSSITITTTSTTKEIPKETPVKKEEEIEAKKEKEGTEPKIENEPPKPKDTPSATTASSSFSFSVSSPSKTSFKMGGTIFKPKAKVLEPKYPLSIKNLYLDAYKYDHNDTYPSWPQQSFQSQNNYQQQPQPQQFQPQNMYQPQPQQFAPIPIAYGYPYNAYYAPPTYYQPTYLQPGYPPYGYN